MSVSVLHFRNDESESLRKTTVIDEYHGVKVEDAHRWLEHSEHPAVKAWTEAQNVTTRAHLDALTDRQEVEAQLNDWFAEVAVGALPQ